MARLLVFDDGADEVAGFAALPWHAVKLAPEPSGCQVWRLGAAGIGFAVAALDTFRPLEYNGAMKKSGGVQMGRIDYVAPMRVTIDTADFRRGYMALVARDGNGTTLLTADEARILARRLDAAAM